VNNILTEAITRHGTGKENLLPVLQYIVAKEKWLKEDLLEETAQRFGISAAEVYGVASFYSFLETEHRGKFVIRVCKTISCEMEGKQEVINAIKEMLHINNGDTTPDGLFTLMETNCIGWCHKGPAMLINDDVYTELTHDKVTDILQSYMYKE